MNFISIKIFLKFVKVQLFLVENFIAKCLDWFEILLNDEMLFWYSVNLFQTYPKNVWRKCQQKICKLSCGTREKWHQPALYLAHLIIFMQSFLWASSLTFFFFSFFLFGNHFRRAHAESILIKEHNLWNICHFIETCFQHFPSFINIEHQLFVFVRNILYTADWLITAKAV